MLLKTIIIFLIVKTSIRAEAAIRSGSNVKSSSSKVKEITLAIEHNLRDGHDQSNDSEKNSPSNRTRANLLLNSKFIYPTGSKRGSAFNQGILKFQQLLDLPINDTSNTQVTFINFDDKGTAEIMNITDHNMTVPERLGIIKHVDTPPKKLTIIEHNKTIPRFFKCSNYSHQADPEDIPKLFEKKFIEDFESSNETSVEAETIKPYSTSERNNSVEIEQDKFNKTLEVEFISPLIIETNNGTNVSKNITKGSVEILDDDNKKKSNSSLNQTFYLNAKQKPTNSRVIEINSQTVEEIPLHSDLQNKASKRDKTQQGDDISQSIKRDILLGNLNPFFSNPSTSSIRNTNTLFFDDSITTPQSSALLSPMNPFIINSVALDSSSPSTFSRSSFSRLRTKSSKSSKKAAVETVPSISVNGKQRFSKPFSELSSSRSSKQKATVKTIPALLIKQEDKQPKFSSKYRSSRPSKSSATSSVSFNISPSVSRSRSSHIRTRTKTTPNYPRARTPSITSVQSSTFSRPAVPSSKISPSSSNVVEVLKSVEYSLPEEVGKSLTKTGASKFKRKVGFERKQSPEYNMQKSVSMDPVTLNLHMTEKSDITFNPYLVNSQMQQLSTESSRSFDFSPSVPDYRTSHVPEFSLALRKNSYFLPMSHFQRREESIQDESNIIEKPYFTPDEDENANQMQKINHLESDLIFKPFFVAQPSRSFQTPETTLNRYAEDDIQVIDLSQF